MATIVTTSEAIEQAVREACREWAAEFMKDWRPHRQAVEELMAENVRLREALVREREDTIHARGWPVALDNDEARNQARAELRAEGLLPPD